MWAAAPPAGAWAPAQTEPQAPAQVTPQAAAPVMPQAAAPVTPHAPVQVAQQAPVAPVPGLPAPQAPVPGPTTNSVAAGDSEAWAELCERFCLQFLLLAERMRPELDLLERQEEDPDLLAALYTIDHGVTRMRRAARDLRVLADRDGEAVSGPDTSLLDVVRMAESSIEQYQQVSILRVVELAVPAYAVEDLASLVAALLDNATRYSPSRVTVSAHLLDNGSVMLRIEDSGIGMTAQQLESLNAALSGPVPAVTGETARRTGFPVVHRLAHRHGVGVRLAARPAGTVAMVTIPASLLCEIQQDEPDADGTGPAPAELTHLTLTQRTEPPARTAPPAAAEDVADLGGLPRRQRTSLRPVATAPAPSPTPASQTAGTTASGDDGAGSFAADLEAFSAGTSGAADGTDGHDREEGRQ